jgi:hypothetical protein
MWLTHDMNEVNVVKLKFFYPKLQFINLSFG